MTNGQNLYKINLLEEEWFWVLGIALICFISRLPLLSSPFLKIDEDECAIGLMALHALQGKELPFYFLGQSYGFAWVETLSTALAFKIFGIGVLPLKFAMLSLWTIGCCFYYRATAFVTNKTYAFMIMIIFIMSPAWMVWSTKARGGYITAFLLSAIVIYWTTRREGAINQKIFAYIGALSGLIYFSQPSFAPLIFIFTVFALWKQKSRKCLASCLIGLISVVILAKVMLLFQENNDLWRPDLFGGPKDFTFIGLKMRLYGALAQGSEDVASRIVVLIWHMLLVIASLLQAISMLKRRLNPFAMIFCASIVILFGSTILFNKNIYGNRYMLTLSVFLAFWFGILYFDLFKKSIYYKTIFIVLFSTLLILGITSSVNFRNYYRTDSDNVLSQSSETQKIQVLIDFLHSHRIKYVYCTDYDLSWKLLFLSKEQIISRWIMIDRIPEYAIAVDNALKSGEAVAVVGIFDSKKVFEIVKQEGNTFVVNDQYFVSLTPSKELIFDKLGFGLQINKINN